MEPKIEKEEIITEPYPLSLLQPSVNGSNQAGLNVFIRTVTLQNFFTPSGG